MSGGTFPSGRLYRSGTFHLLTRGEAEELVSSLGLVTVIDLRTPSERVGRSHRFPDRVEVLEIPFLTEIDPKWEHPTDQSPRAVADRYLEMLERQGSKALHAIIAEITPNRLPLVIQCNAGKDRTGIATALLLALAGVTDEAIGFDYARSGPVLQHLATDPATAGIFAPDPVNEYETFPETMRVFLNGVRKQHASSQGLAVIFNVGASDLQRARAALLTPQVDSGQGESGDGDRNE